MYTFFGVEITKVLDKEDGVDPLSQKICLETFAPTDFCVSTDASNISVVECSQCIIFEEELFSVAKKVKIESSFSNS